MQGGFSLPAKWIEGISIFKRCPYYNNERQEFRCIYEIHDDYPHTFTVFTDIDLVNHPPHYTKGKFEVIDVLEDWQLNYHLACVVKYIARCDLKSDAIQDLKKARWYLDREISRREQK